MSLYDKQEQKEYSLLIRPVNRLIYALHFYSKFFESVEEVGQTLGHSLRTSDPSPGQCEQNTEGHDDSVIIVTVQNLQRRAQARENADLVL